MTHNIPTHVLPRDAVRVAVVGCGGNGSMIATGLPYLDQALLAASHRGGLDATLVEGDIISPTNCVRPAVRPLRDWPSQEYRPRFPH